MSDFSQGDGWWQASDDKWYPPEQAPGYQPPAPYPAAAYGTPHRVRLPATGYGYPALRPQERPAGHHLAVLRIGGTVFGLLCCLGIGATIAAIIVGLRSKKKIAASGGALTGEGLAQAGFIIGIVGTVLIVLVIGGSSRHRPERRELVR